MICKIDYTKLKAGFVTIVVGMSMHNIYADVPPITINENSSVTITYIAPNAKKVQVQGNFFNKRNSIIPIVSAFSKDGKADMKQDVGGVWTFTTSPLSPELYWYNFIVDETDTTKYDERNKNITRDISTIYNYFIIKGGDVDNYIDNVNVRQGRVEYVWYPSNMNGMTKRRMSVYLPSLYSEDETQQFPVLYLLHGSGGDETAWCDCGRIKQIMDNLISSGKCVPMIVVMPNGNVELAAAPGDDPENPNIKASANNTSSMFGKVESAFVPEIVRYVDSHYRTISNKSHRAIAGLSLGGLHTLYIALNNPTTFDYIGLFSAQTTNALGDKSISRLKSLNESWKNLKDALPFISGSKVDGKISNITTANDGNIDIYADFDNKIRILYENNPKLFYIAVGTEDFTKKLNDELRKTMNQHNYKYLYNETDGGHTWTNWRRYVVDFLPKLFK